MKTTFDFTGGYDPIFDHWVNNPLISPASKVELFNNTVELHVHWAVTEFSALLLSEVRNDGSSLWTSGGVQESLVRLIEDIATKVTTDNVQ